MELDALAKLPRGELNFYLAWARYTEAGRACTCTSLPECFDRISIALFSRSEFKQRTQKQQPAMLQLLLDVFRMLSANKFREQLPEQAPSPCAQGRPGDHSR